MNKKAPKYDGDFCDMDCPYFKKLDELIGAKCELTGKDIDFYDWWLKHCSLLPEGER